MKPSDLAILLLISALGLGQVQAGEVVYFLVAEGPSIPETARKNDSYVLPLSKQEDIDHARYIISRWQSGYFEVDRAIVGAKVIAGKDGINRNYLDPKFPEWSWYVVESGFADIMAEIYDGTPTQLENGFADWPHDSDGHRQLDSGLTVLSENSARRRCTCPSSPRGRISNSTGAVSAPTMFLRWKAKAP